MEGSPGCEWLAREAVAARLSGSGGARERGHLFPLGHCPFCSSPEEVNTAFYQGASWPEDVPHVHCEQIPMCPELS